MNIVETRTFQLGQYTVQQRPRFDSPSWGQYLVFLGNILIGKSFSMPDIGCCEWLEHHQRHQTMYAYSSAKLPELTGVRRGARYLAHKRSR